MSRHLRIKICGVTNVKDALLAAECGADAVGLNLHPGSPRYIDAETARSISQQLPVFTQAVGVFVNVSMDAATRVLQKLHRIRVIQWHGDEANREIRWMAPFHLITAFRVQDAASLDFITHWLEECLESDCLPSAVLVDANVPGQYGGTGQTAPWDLLASFRPSVPLILAGGLTPENVAEAVRIVRPYGVDVASGVEENPRRKDPDKMRRFIDNARAAV